MAEALVVGEVAMRAAPGLREVWAVCVALVAVLVLTVSPVASEAVLVGVVERLELAVAVAVGVQGLRLRLAGERIEVMASEALVAGACL